MKGKTMEFKNLVRHPFAWPGGYPRFAVMQDGGTLCALCAKTEAKLIIGATRDNSGHTGWEFEGADINWEDSELYCGHCGNRIQSAYGNDTE